MLHYNKEEFRDKVRACWLGKNIGGTLGGPYEGKRDILNVEGFVTSPGEPLPNDDLDLQLVWLNAVQRHGLDRITPELLGQYWIDRIVPYWNEYGIGKINMKAGILPPMSGEFDNNYWKHSNGAWIRTEIWACLTPGWVQRTCQLAYCDASVDHGHGEGTNAAIFVAAIESAAFVETNIRKLIDIGLMSIPPESRVVRSVSLALECFNNGLDWKETRKKIVQDSADLGWFQAPANVAFVIIGLLWGKGDFKTSMLIAINCGDDTDCTAATIGSIMGILYGTKGIPTDWTEYIGDKIITISLNRALPDFMSYPNTITELTDAVVAQVIAHSFSVGKRLLFDFTEGKTWNEHFLTDSWGVRFPKDDVMTLSPYYYAAGNDSIRVIAEFSGEPRVAPCEELPFHLVYQNPSIFNNKTATVRFLGLNGFTITGDGITSIKCIKHKCSLDQDVFEGKGNYVLKSPDTVPASTRIVAEISITDQISPIYLPITVFSR